MRWRRHKNRDLNMPQNTRRSISTWGGPVRKGVHFQYYPVKCVYKARVSHPKIRVYGMNIFAEGYIHKPPYLAVNVFRAFIDVRPLSVSCNWLPLHQFLHREVFEGGLLIVKGNVLALAKVCAWVAYKH